MLYQIAYIISRNFHCDAIIPVVKLFWRVALEPMAGSKCQPGQGQRALKLESRFDVIKTLFATAMAAQDNVSAQKAFLEESGCNACRYSACDVIIMSQTGQLAWWFNTSLSAREVLGSIFGPVPAVSSVVKRFIGAKGLGFDSRKGQIGTESPTARHRCDASVLPKR